MNGWQLATDASIWILIVGSLVVFGWFLYEVVRLARVRRADPGRDGRHGPGAGLDDASSSPPRDQ